MGHALQTKRAWLFGLLIILSSQWGIAQKPDIWIISDFTGADGFKISTEDESQLNTTSDSDDHAALAMYLMKANEFNTRGIVIGSNRGGDRYDALQTFNDRFRTAYAADISCLTRKGLNYPSAESLRVMLAGTIGTSYQSNDDYRNLDELPASARELVLELGKDRYSVDRPLYVLSWGPLTETAVVLKHLITNDKTKELSRLHIVSHWTTSFIARSNPATCFEDELDAQKFGVSNCRSDCEACDYVHAQAVRSNAAFRFTDLGAIGQRGIVNGSASFFPEKFSGPRANAFKQSGLGQLFIEAKFRNGKPDGSDSATFYAILGDFGVQLSDFNDNGVLTLMDEERANDTFFERAEDIMQDLLNIVELSSENCSGTTTGTGAVHLQAPPRVYPNPVEDTLFVEGVGRTDRLEVFTPAGQRVAVQTGSGFVSVGELPTGVYFLKVEGYRAARFMKQ